MAFEGVFQNIDFQAPVRAEAQQRGEFMQALGQSLARAERAEDRDIKRRQLEVKAQGDYKQRAMDELNRINMGGAPTPEGQSAIRVMQQTTADQVYPDPITGEMIVKPSPWSGAGQGIAQAPQGANTLFADSGQGSVSAEYFDSLPMPQGGNVPTTPVIRPDARTAQQNIDALSQPAMDMSGLDEIAQSGVLAGTRAGQLKAEESKQRMREKFIADKMITDNKGLRKYNESQLASANFANRMSTSSDIIETLESKASQAKTGTAGYAEAVLSAIPSMGITDKMGKGIVKMSATPEQQQYLNSAQNWIRANLRKESGAVIGEQEMIDEYATYFPTAGDTKEVMQQKARLRKDTEKGVITQSAGAYQEAFGKKAQANQSKPSREQILQELQRRRGQ